MRCLFKIALAGITLAGAAPTIAAQTIVVQRNVNLRSTPSSDLPPIRLLLPPQALQLLDSVKTNNYYHVVFEEAPDTGWVWANNVRIVSDAALESSTVAAAIDSNWTKPQPVVASFKSPVRDSVCGPVGDPTADSATNRLKNRTDVPPNYHVVAFNAIADLRYPATRATFRTKWPAESVAVLRRVEGVAVQIVGYLAAIKPQSGNQESTNCYLTRSAETDWHVAVTESFGENESDAVVVEPTPRVRINHPRWTEGRLSPWVHSPDPVRISGWLMFDPAHRNHLGRFRKTLWEIHPVTKIEVWRNGEWVSLDSLP